MRLCPLSCRHWPLNTEALWPLDLESPRPERPGNQLPAPRLPDQLADAGPSVAGIHLPLLQGPPGRRRCSGERSRAPSIGAREQYARTTHAGAHPIAAAPAEYVDGVE
eukprot:scaffold44848_cov66-Phaeocystis_antarctica.AAC.3